MKRITVTASILLLAGCASMTDGPGAAARADLRDANGQPVGTARFEEAAGGVRIVLELRGMPPGAHGVHIHAVGKCEPPGFASAGGHFNPGNRQHGTMNPQGPHAGDLPNITVETAGTGRLETTTDRITLGGGPTSILDADGSALVVHAAADDFTTDPSGNTGPRIACGIIAPLPRRAATQPAGGGGYGY